MRIYRAKIPRKKVKIRHQRTWELPNNRNDQWLPLQLNFLDLEKFRKKNNSPPLMSGHAYSVDFQKVIKIEFQKHPRKINTLSEEAEIIRHLNNHGCKSTPSLLCSGSLESSNFLSISTSLSNTSKSDSLKTSFNYIIQEYIPSTRHIKITEIIKSILEQKSFGIYHADIKPENIRFDKRKKRAVFIDYDQSIWLDCAVSNLNNKEFFLWCEKYENIRYSGKYNSWTRHFKNLNYKKDIEPHLYKIQ